MLYPFLLFSTALAALFLLFLYIKSRRKEILLLEKLQGLTETTDRSGIEMIKHLETKLLSLKDQNCSETEYINNLSKSILDQTISVKEGFNEILNGAAEVGKMTEEKMSYVEEAAESSKDIVSAVSNITENMEVQVSLLKN